MGKRFFTVPALIVAAAVAAYAAGDEVMPIETIVVTGTRVPDAQPMGIVTLDRAAIDQSGAVTLNGLVRDMVLNSAGIVDEQFTQGFAPASAAVDLRGLGVNRTLVLLNGRRLPMFPFAMNGSESFTDINLIPLSAVERIEVLKDGASAVYGSDALAGVVNIITRQANTPGHLSARYSGSTEGDGREAAVGINGGVTLAQAELGFALEYLDRQPIMSRDRSISATANGPIDDRSSAGNPGTFITSSGPVPDPACPAERLRGPFCTYDFAPDTTLVPGTTRIGAMGSLDRGLTDTTGLFAQVMYNTSESARDLAGAGNGYPVGAANVNNPFGEDVLAIYRLNELGPRRDTFDTETYNVLAGFNGVTNGWSWELAGGYGKVDTLIRGVSGYALANDVQDAIDAGTLNVFGASPNLDPAALSYQTRRDGASELALVDLKVNGNLFDVGQGAVGAAFGVEYRDERFADELDQASASGAVIGVGGVRADGGRDAWATFAELVVPLVADVELQVAGRYDDYSDFGGTFNPKLGIHWQASSAVVVRATAGTGFKAPALHELYAGDIVGFDSVFDTTNCDAARAAGDADGIAAYCDAVQEVMFITSGNTNLNAEASVNLGLGFEWDATEHWSLGLDLWRIDNEDAVTSSPQFFIDAEDRFPDNVARDGDGDITTVFSPFQNIASQELWGLDFDSRVRLETTSLGAFEAQLVAAHLGGLKQRSSVGEPEEELAGVDGNAEWRARADLSWSRTDYRGTVTVHYVDGYQRPTADDVVGSWTTVDVRLVWAPTMLKGGAVDLGLDNVADAEPPIDPFLEGWPFFNRALHDPRGRFFFVRYAHDF